MEFRKDIDVARYGSGSSVCADTFNNSDLPCADICAQPYGAAVSSNYSVHSCYCRFGADGGDYIEESFAVALPGIRHISSADYHQLCRIGRCDSCYPEGVFVNTERRVCFSTAVGFAVALIIFAGIREQLAMVSIPKGMRGMAIVLVTAGLLSLAFMGFSGVDGGLKALFGLN